MSLSATVKASVAATQTRDLDLASGSSTLSRAVAASFTNGTGLNQANLIWHDQRTLVNTEDLDLSGALTDIYGQSVVFARIKALLLESLSSNGSNITLSRGSSNGVPLFTAASDGIIIRPGGALLWVAPDATGIAVTASTGDILTVTNGSASSPQVSVTYNIVIIGADA